MKFLRPLLMLFLLLPALALARNAPLIDPPPLAVPSGLTAATVAKAIRAGLTRRAWTVEAESPGTLKASVLVRGKHLVKVTVSYSATMVSMKYLDSTNMDYEENGGTPAIHPQYMKWTATAMREIEAALNQAQ